MNDAQLLNQKQFIQKIQTSMNYVPRIGIFGAKGAGKSSLCTALFDKKLTKISGVSNFVPEMQAIYSNAQIKKVPVILVGAPGLEEESKSDEDYFELYERLASELDLVIWVIKADDEVHEAAEQLYNDILKDKCLVLFILTQVDKVEPVFDWDIEKNRPKKAKEENIKNKINEISSIFNISTNVIEMISVTENYHVTETMERIINIMPQNKKYSVSEDATVDTLINDTQASDTSPQSLEATIQDEVGKTVKQWGEEFWNDNKDVAGQKVKDLGRQVIEKGLSSVLSIFGKK